MRSFYVLLFLFRFGNNFRIRYGFYTHAHTQARTSRKRMNSLHYFKQEAFCQLRMFSFVLLSQFIAICCSLTKLLWWLWRFSPVSYTSFIAQYRKNWFTQVVWEAMQCMVYVDMIYVQRIVRKWMSDGWFCWILDSIFCNGRPKVRWVQKLWTTDKNLIYIS